MVNAGSEEKSEFVSIEIYNPLTRLKTVLSPRTLIAMQSFLDYTSSRRSHLEWWTHLDQANLNPNLEVLDLGGNIIQELAVHGYRRVLTIPAETSGTGKPIEVTDEVWYNEDLRINLIMKHNDPRTGGVVATVTSINLNEPDASLFMIPADYNVVDEAPALPGKP